MHSCHKGNSHAFWQMSGCSLALGVTDLQDLFSKVRSCHVQTASAQACCLQAHSLPQLQLEYDDNNHGQ